MKVTRFFGLWALSVLCVLSCTDGEQGTGGIIPDVATKPVRLSLGTTPMQEAGSVTRVRGDNSLDLVLGEETGKGACNTGTRTGTLTDTQEDVVNDICVFQFGNTDGKLKYSEYTSLMDGELTADISLASGVGSCTVYVLANVGNIIRKVAYGSALADFKKLAAEVSSGKGTGQNLPMCGYKADFNSDADNASLTVSLTRAVAKVSLNLTTPNAGDAFTVTSVRLMNVAKKLYYVESATTAPTAAELTTYTSDNTKSITWYIPENKAGSNALTNWKDRHEGNAPATATYILIEGSYTPQNGTARDVSYAIYLGAGNSAADFNVVRNTKYAVNAAIKGTDMNDGRVLIGRDLSAAGTQTANCYVVKTTDANKWYRIKVQTYETRPRNGLAPYADITKREFKMMDRNLGSASGKATKVAEEAIKTYGVYFQFGRKDPFPAAGVMTRTNDADIVPVYDANGNKILKNSNQIKNSTITKGIDQAAVKLQLAYVVENPLMFILRDDDDKLAIYGGDSAEPSYNWIFAAHPAKNDKDGSVPWKASNKLWGSGVQDERNSLILGTIINVKKTIYDPCPYGYHMPPQDAWTNFTTVTTAYITNIVTEYNVIAEDKYNQTTDGTGFVDENFKVWGRRFFTTGNTAIADASNVAFYPAMGYRFGDDGRVHSVGRGCYAWSASPYSAKSSKGGFLGTGADWVHPVSATFRSDAFPVRCVRD